MQNRNLVSIFESLPRPEASKDAQNFSAVQLEGTSHRVGKDSSGWPALLLKTSSSHSSARIRLEHLDVQHSVRCRVTNNKTAEEGLYTVIRCTEANDELAVYFLHTIDPIIRLIGPKPTSAEVLRAISHLVELFRALTQAPIKSVSGLWAELFVIQSSGDPVALLRAWHVSPDEKYDFSFGSQRIEVKSTSQRARLHHFSLEQLVPPSGCRVIVASVFVERNGGGTSLGDLVEDIGSHIANEPELQERLDHVVASTLGQTLREGLLSRFDLELARESIRFFTVQMSRRYWNHYL